MRLVLTENMILKYLAGVVFCFLPVFTYSQESCSISVVTRLRCSTNSVITDETACMAAGCCFDRTAGLPSSGKCYKKSEDYHFAGLDFSPTSPTNYRNIAGLLMVGGEPGYPGSELVLRCNLLKLCQTSISSYPNHYRSDCLRQGCCWSAGKCYQNDIHILRLRKKCQYGFKEPPACDTVINPCDENPCQNGGVCTFTGPGEFSCACKTGFSGKTCYPNCKASQLSVKNANLGSTRTEYMIGTKVSIQCVSGTIHQSGAILQRECVDGQFSPSLSTHPVNCYSNEKREACSSYVHGGVGFNKIVGISNLDYNKAEISCQNVGGYIPYKNMKTSADRTRVMDTLGVELNFFWINLNDRETHDVWKWGDGTIADKNTVGFAPGEPNHGGAFGQEDCIMSWRGSGTLTHFNLLNDFTCSSTLHELATFCNQNFGWPLYGVVLICEFDC